MKILFLHKRFYMQKDLINDCYGRFFEIPDYLAKSGHQADLICHSYRSSEDVSVADNKNYSIFSRNLGLNPLYGFWKHYHYLDKALKGSRPEIIIAGSDCYQIIIGAALGSKHDIPFIADLYDNFSYYRASRIPGILPLFYRALKQADAVTVVSNGLKRLLEGKGISAGRLHLLENAVAEKFLIRHDKQSSRNRFGFEDGRIYIGTAGELSREKGVEVLIKAFVEIVMENPALSLVLAGEKEKNLVIPEQDNILWLGSLRHDEIPVLFAALDLGVICIKDNEFGRYCFPQKFYEMAACGLPLIASAVGEMPLLLKDTPALLFRPDDSEDLKRAMQEQIANKNILTMDIPTWERQAGKIDGLIRNIAGT